MGPVGVYDESLNFPADEEDRLIAPLLVRLARRDSWADLSQYLWDESRDNYFGLDPVRRETDHFADRLPGVVRREASAGFLTRANIQICRTANGTGDWTGSTSWPS